MCGIVGFTGNRQAAPILLDGLSKLEYRGYDSAGLAVRDGEALAQVVKAKGRLSNLIEKTDAGNALKGTCGIGHTRWATHGVPSNMNSHPHTNESETISIVHNGIIENYASIKECLLEQGYKFQSQTDSEVIVHMLDYYYQGDMMYALKKCVQYLQGSFALCVVCTDYPDCVFVAKKESPMIVGKTDMAAFCASDIPAVLDYTKDICALEDNQMAILKPGSIELYDFFGDPVSMKWTHISYDACAAQKGGYDTFMQKEMHEQPYVIKETLRAHIENNLAMPELSGLDVSKINQIYFVACGTAYHASLYAQYLLRTWIDLPIYCISASEFRYGNYRIDENTLCIFVSQSGETADTLAALKLSKENKAQTLAVTNVLGSSLARLSDFVLYTCAGPEIAVASTKAYTTQLVLLACLCLKLAALCNGDVENKYNMINQLKQMPEVVEEMLQQEDKMAEFAKLLTNQKDAYFIGRQLDYLSVLEGALKLKEVSYVHADAYMAGELKHGPIALIEKDTVVIALATQPSVAQKTISNILETVARGAKVILITSKNQNTEGFDYVIRIPDVDPLFSSIPATVLLQELAYYVAKEKGCDVDKPRNLAKSVTVE